MMRWPAGFKGGRTFTAPAAYIDLLPTFAAAANTAIPEGVDGVNLLPVIAGDDSHSDRVLLLGKDSAVSGSWKLKGDELFDLEVDPGETTNISPRHPEHVIRLRGELANFPAMQGPRFTTKLPKPTQWPPVNWQLPAEP